MIVFGERVHSKDHKRASSLGTGTVEGIRQDGTVLVRWDLTNGISAEWARDLDPTGIIVRKEGHRG